MFQRIINLFFPERFQGWGKKKNYFEGWYFKFVDASKNTSIVFIFGISFDKNGRPQVFAQHFDSKTYHSNYTNFDLKDFSAQKNQFEIKLAKNIFSADGLEISLSNCEGKLKFLDKVIWPRRVFAPGIMSFLAFLPFLECRHDVIIPRCRLEGKIQINGKEVDFTGGQGYVEKDWGKSFPDWHIWLAGNNFIASQASIFFSVAKVPLWIFQITGFICFLERNGKFINFNSYNFSKIKKLKFENEELKIKLANNKFDLSLEVKNDKGVELFLPRNGLMSETLSESITAQAKVELIEKNKNEVIFSDAVEFLGLETAGKIIEK